MAKALKFKFEASQLHQKEAIGSVVGMFKGFSQDIAGFQLEYDVVPNIQDFYDFDEEWLYGNYQEVINTNNSLKLAAGVQPDLPMNASLMYEDGFMLSGIDDRAVRFPVFTVEMETGTGKTYTYFRTIHELKQQYGFRKFIVVVPSVAIYEGTIKAFKQTKEHFKTLYGNENIHLTEYDGQQISRVRSFATSSFTEIMVMTIDSFNKSSNIIYKPTEKLQGEWLPIQYIQATRPILILDESQNYRSALSRDALRTLNPLFAINYSATPIDKYNLLYRLTPVDALRHNLVKRIEVLGVTQQHNLNDKTLSMVIEEFHNEMGAPTVTIQAYILEKGIKKQRPVRIKKGDNLEKKTGNPDLAGFIVEEIHVGERFVRFTNQSELRAGVDTSITLSNREVYRVQIEETIKMHFERQKKLKEKGIKVLSLFFIDRVAHYVGEEPFIKTMFEAAFEKYKGTDSYFKNFKPEEVHRGYFAKKKGDTGFLDSFETAGEKASERKRIQEAEKEAFHLIMQDKETLLSFPDGRDELKKTAFIFAHSALREGWDNPNVFNICLLKPPVYDTANQKNTRRQELGRGLRLSVNQEGSRVMEEGVNILTVICPEDFSNYVKNLQKEYISSGDIPPSSPTDAKRAKAKRNNEIYRNADFRAFWLRLMQETSYTIQINSQQVIEKSIERLNNLTGAQDFPESKIILTKGQFVNTSYTFILKEVKNSVMIIQLLITDSNGRNEQKELKCVTGYDFWRKSKDENLKGFKIMELNSDVTEPKVFFGNGQTLTKDEPIVFSGNPDVFTHQRSVFQQQNAYPVFNLPERVAKSTGLTRPTALAIFKGLSQRQKEKVFNNPEGFSAVFIKEVKEVLATHIAETIEYRLTETYSQKDYLIDEPGMSYAAEDAAFYGVTSLDDHFPPEKEFAQRELIPGSESSLYDQIQTDSDVERNFVQYRIQDEDAKGNIVCYFKFPANFKIRIPKIIGNYNPDWGIVRYDEKGNAKIQLVRETKGTMNPNLLQFPHEKRKIDCAKKHFEVIGINYRQVTDQIPNWWEGD